MIFLFNVQLRNKYDDDDDEISSYSDDSRLRYGAITIFKMAPVRHVGFSKFDIFIS